MSGLLSDFFEIGKFFVFVLSRKAEKLNWLWVVCLYLYCLVFKDQVFFSCCRLSLSAKIILPYSLWLVKLFFKVFSFFSSN